MAISTTRSTTTTWGTSHSTTTVYNTSITTSTNSNATYLYHILETESNYVICLNDLNNPFNAVFLLCYLVSWN